MTEWSRLRFRGQEALLVGVSVLGEVDAVWRPLGANEVDVEAGAIERLDDEQRAELVGLIRDELGNADESVAAHPPVVADGTAAAVEAVGDAPPRSGTGSSRTAWATYAEKLNAAGVAVTVTEDMSRDDIVTAVDKAVEAAS